jgi:hypothetical protein
MRPVVDRNVVMRRMYSSVYFKIYIIRQEAEDRWFWTKWQQAFPKLTLYDVTSGYRWTGRPGVGPVIAEVLNKQLRTVDKGWPSSLGAGRGDSNS